MSDPARPLTVRAHGLAHARAAADVAAACGRRLVLLSPADAAAAAGPSWFRALVDRVRAEHPGLDVTEVLDCGDRAGDAMAAVRLGVRRISFDGDAETVARLVDMGAEVVAPPGAALDLLDAGDPAAACRGWLERGR